MYYNYKGNYSIVLLASCDANYTFTTVDIGAYGSQSDGGILWNCDFGQGLLSGNLDLPVDDYLPGTLIKFPHFMVGDAAFPLKNCIMRPYPGIRLPIDREVFNKRLSRARRTIENAFGILCARWRVMLAPIFMHPQTAETIVKAAVLLHNFVKFNDRSYCPADYVDQYQGEEVINGLWRKEVPTPLRNHGRMACNNATREHLRCGIN
ncbi:PREDICTED: uncharacterized protein LOC108361815 isoform X1 [Rhagoletis zephyria]|uniref:uncharacterized protein LOC108361815 isoform X1 n=1 Tax=Rhagoletis zephyria TaxID=28612 RepID=UPI0008116DAA|nr:PREDICTED: uncharacterized protein LOC108361815 isoform X1 [Rhagoletis zephyria]